MEKLLRVGHSPDADDAFMFYGIAHGKVPLNGFKIEHVIEDIQTLNLRALKGELEITAISTAVYPFLADKYWILSCGSSVGRKYGPLIVAPKKYSKEELKGKRIGIPGFQTTAYALLKIFLKDFEPVAMDFKEVIPALERGEIEAGLIIHEGQLNYDSFGLKNCLDLGICWFEKYNLPIPLGLDIVRKDLGLEMAKKIKDILAKSIQYALENEDEALVYSLKFGRGVSKEVGREFVKMYVNEDTLDLGAEGALALQKFFEEGKNCGLFPTCPSLNIL